jgi:hypothetical protein
MIMKSDNHIFSGLQRDVSISKSNPQFLWDAHNIRITTRGGETLLSLSNERGTSSITTDDGNAGVLTGNYIGHCILGNFLIVFTKGPNDYIYRIRKADNEYEVKVLYSGNINLDLNFPIETLGIYENENIQKVYWVDGRNQPRVLNIMQEYIGKSSTVFDFVKELKLQESVYISNTSGGSFAAGVIQYAFSYYNKYGSESNIFYTSELYNIANIDRGGNGEEVIDTAFNITIDNIDTNFEYLRIYSIHRTSLDATPTAKIVTDIAIGTDSTIQYIDTGTVGSTIDPMELLYIGGESITAGTLTQKDNTLFMGDISLLRDRVENIRDIIQSDVQVSVNKRSIEIGSEQNNGFYNYVNQLHVNNISTFKCGNTYRIGLQFQHKSGKWSDPLYIKDFPIPTDSDIRPTLKDGILSVPQINVTIPRSILSMISGYKRVRAVIVFPRIYDRKVLAQGILCPTVFSIDNRVSNTPFSQSSWFFRPMWSTSNNGSNINLGATVPYKHLDALLSGQDRGAEIQNMQSLSFTQANSKVKSGESSINTFFIDQSILTFHSPDIEFNSSVRQALDGGEFDLNIVGLAQITSSAGDINIQTSSGVPAPNNNGFYHKSILNTDKLGVSTGLVSGMFYKSHPIDEDNDANTYGPYNYRDQNWELNWLIYPWHRSGSLNNDCVRPDGKGTRTSELSRKVVSNIKVAEDTKWLSSKFNFEYGITNVSIFDSNEVSLIKIPTPKNSSINTLNYYGNVDTLISATQSFNFYVTPNAGVRLGNMSTAAGEPFTQNPLYTIQDIESVIGDFNPSLRTSKEPVRMKYKSSPHAVFALNYGINGSPTILPKISSSSGTTLNGISSDLSIEVPFWSQESGSAFVPDNIIDADYQRFINTVPGQSSDSIEKSIANTLATEYPGARIGQIAISNCSVRANDVTQADIYKVVETQNKLWERLPLDSSYENTIYQYGGIQWKVVFNGSRWALKKLDSTTTTYGINQGNIVTTPYNGTLFIAELVRKEEPKNIFGGSSREDIMNNLWIPASSPIYIDDTGDMTISITRGDTYYQRYDCLKTYPYSMEDTNSIVEIGSFLCESYVNIDGRYDRNRGQLSNLNVSGTNFNLINPVYSQTDSLFNYRIQDEDYYRDVNYPIAVTWSLEKYNSSVIDNWTKVTLSNILYLDGRKGRVNSLKVNNNVLYSFQDTGISQILFNSRVQIPSSDGVPIEISNNYKVEGYRYFTEAIGCKNKWSIANTPTGLYFIDSISNSLYNIGNNGLSSISTSHNMRDWFSKQKAGIWTPASWGGFKSFYDNLYNDLYIISDRECLVYSELLGQFTSFMSYESTQALDNVGSGLFAIRDNGDNCQVWKMFDGEYNSFFGEYKPFDITFISNPDSSEDKIFTNIEARADFVKEGVLQHNRFFDYIQVTNEYQDTGVVPITFNAVAPSNLKKKFRIWRMQIPRDAGNKIDRIRNTWAKIKLGMDKDKSNNLNMTLHDISVQYMK